MKKLLLIFLLACSGFQGFAQKQSAQPMSLAERLKWWQDAKMGLFIHWGPVSLIGQEISWSRKDYGPEKYDALYKKFNPEKFSAKEWVALAKASGMKYMVLTAKHHDGFCLFDTKTTSYNIMNAPFGRDVCKELAQAAHEAGMPIGWYFSVADWKDPDCRDPQRNPVFAERVLKQVSELLTNYGKIGLLWIDFEGWPSPVEPRKVYDLARTLQPEIIINNRLEPFTPDESHGYVGQYADYATPEGFVAGYGTTAWETCTNMGHQWAWKFGDHPRSLKESVHTLLRCVGGNGNLLFNIGPDSTGVFPADFVARAHEMGSWISKNQAAIYGTKGGVYTPAADYVSSYKDNKLYIHLLNDTQTELTLPGIPAKVKSAALADGSPVTFSQSTQRLKIQFPKAKIDSVATIAVLTMDKPLASLSPVIPFSTSRSLAYGKKATASSAVGQFYHDPAAAFDDNPKTCWKIGRRKDIDVHQVYGKNIHYLSEEIMSLYEPKGWLEVDLGKPHPVGRIKLGESRYSDSAIRRFKVQYLAGSTWTDLAEGSSMGDWQKEIRPVTAQKFRLVIDEYQGYFGVNEFELFPPNL
ncbi:alpha-L-fucosidase [Dyadobacter sandarakinus]|uniref:alpha-L-fucosidase n=1 Tax=Dyadobacter sandarakinus TaxID=2747268 RepID=A0ABX7I4C0_9BACT|nr:alpha-L-fucosidase [Dyadobacter sandarakinus]QRR00689.1 alpha-L-fucosidase [Dyadobacter sandarakinus]